jgi:hypothetical protein
MAKRARTATTEKERILGAIFDLGWEEEET